MNSKNKKNWKYILLFQAVFLGVTGVFCTTIGAADISFRESAGILLSRIPFIKNWFPAESYSVIHQTIILSLRMPRIVLAALVGGALSMVGGTLQGFFKNTMADPYIMGVSSGAALGATIAIVSGMARFLGIMRIPVFAFAGAFLSTWIVYSLARVGKKVVVSTLLLAGIALSSFLSAVMSLLMVFNAEEIDKVYIWLLGSFANKNWDHVQISAPFIIIGAVSLIFFAKEMNALAFGDSTAQHLGVNLARMQIAILICTSLTTAGAVAVCGSIGFVGLIIPHVVRILLGPDHRILLPFSFLLGGTFLVVTDTFARTVLAPLEIPVGIITAMFGGPFFIYLLKRKKESY